MYEGIPYLSILLNLKTNETILCLINLQTKNYISYYSLQELEPSDYMYFLELTQSWFLKCPLIPISLYYKKEFRKLNYCKHFMFSGDFQIIGGFNGTNLKNISEKRIKRKIIHIDQLSH
jgi:hypothetical protein